MKLQIGKRFVQFRYVPWTTRFYYTGQFGSGFDRGRYFHVGWMGIYVGEVIP